MATIENYVLADIHIRQVARNVLPYNRVLAAPGEIFGQACGERRAYRMLRDNGKIHN